MLQRHADAPQTALDQLIMLQRCVDDAAATAAVAGELPDPLAWESCSGSGSEDEHGLGGGGAGASWAQDLTPEELAAMEQGTFPPDLLEGQRHEQPAAAAPAGGAGWLSQEDQLAVLKAQFGGMPDRELAEALGACDGDVFAAAELLRSFMAEDAAGAGMSSAGLNGGVLLGSMAGVAATVPAPAALPSALLEPGGSSVLPQHVGPKVQHLARRFPGAPTEALQVRIPLGGRLGCLVGAHTMFLLYFTTPPVSCSHRWRWPPPRMTLWPHGARCARTGTARSRWHSRQQLPLPACGHPQGCHCPSPCGHRACRSLCLYRCKALHKRPSRLQHCHHFQRHPISATRASLR